MLPSCQPCLTDGRHGSLVLPGKIGRSNAPSTRKRVPPAPDARTLSVSRGSRKGLSCEDGCGISPRHRVRFRFRTVLRASGCPFLPESTMMRRASELALALRLSTRAECVRSCRGSWGDRLTAEVAPVAHRMRSCPAHVGGHRRSDRGRGTWAVRCPSAGNPTASGLRQLPAPPRRPPAGNPKSYEVGPYGRSYSQTAALCGSPSGDSLACDEPQQHRADRIGSRVSTSPLPVPGTGTERHQVEWADPQGHLAVAQRDLAFAGVGQVAAAAMHGETRCT